MKRLLTALILVTLAWSCTDVNHATLPSETTPVPRRTYTLSGFAFEATPNGREPVEGVSIDAFVCQAGIPNCIELLGVTDGNGYYSIPGMWAGFETPLWVFKAGYAVDGGLKDYCDFCDRLITASVDTKLDFTLIRK